MFGDNFLNLFGFIQPTPIFFASTMLGLIPPVITQLFLLRRIVLFVSSLEVLWPVLAKPIAKYTFLAVLGLGIAMSFSAGVASCVLIFHSGEYFIDLALGDAA